MIRINLLPVQQDRQRQSGAQQLAVALLLLLVEALVLFFIHRNKTMELTQAQARSSAVESEVTQLRARSEQVRTLNSQREQLQSMARVLEDLEANRAGPVQVLDELKAMLNPPANELQRAAQQHRSWDTNWDPRNVWLTEFNEVNGAVSIQGRAASNDDIAEFNTRLASSIYFSAVRLNQSRVVTQDGLGRVYQFQLSAQVNYGVVDDGGV
jgi:Tfp pilus assembly protein PilN